MENADGISILVSPAIPTRQLFGFYERNNICEAGYGAELAAGALERSDLVVGAFEAGELVGLARVLCDGLHAVIVEFSVELRLQGGQPIYHNGSLIEHDTSGVGRRIGEAVLSELERMGACFISVGCLKGVEEGFYAQLGFRHNRSMLDYIIDWRPYIRRQE